MRILSKGRASLILLSSFILIEAALAVALQLTSGLTSRILSYAVVVLAFLLSLCFLSSSAERVATSAGLALTLVADFYLVILDDHYALAVSFFAMAQLAYAARVYFAARSAAYCRTQLLVRLCVGVISIILPHLILGGGADYLSVICVFYFANLLLNTVFAFIDFGRMPLFAVGLLLFCFCDVFVGFSKLGMYITISPGSLAWWLAHPGFNAAWVFYAPSQTLIAVSHIGRRGIIL